MTYQCKGCNKPATEEQILDAAGRVKDIEALLNGQTPWICAACHLKYLEGSKKRTQGTPLQLASTEELIRELLSRHQHTIIAFRTVPIEGVNDAMEGLYHHGDYRMCQGLAQGVIGKMERDIVAATDRRRSEFEHEEADDV